MSLRSPSSQLSCPVLLLPGGTRSHCAQKILLNLILTLMGDINKGMYFLPKHSQPLGTWQCYSHSFCSLWNEFQAAVLNLDTVSYSFDILEGNLSLLIYLFICFCSGKWKQPTDVWLQVIRLASENISELETLAVLGNKEEKLASIQSDLSSMLIHSPFKSGLVSTSL